MKAAVYREHNKDPRKVVKIEDTEIPKIKHNQVLIKVEAASYNYNISGEYGEIQLRFLLLTFLEVTMLEQ